MLIYKVERVKKLNKLYNEIKMFFFKTREDADKFINRDKQIHSNVDYYFEENTFDGLKKEMTISDYEKLFNTTVMSNHKLLPYELKEGLHLWDQTEEKYINTRYIQIGKDYYYGDDFGNIIEDDELYFYRPNE